MQSFIVSAIQLKAGSDKRTNLDAAAALAEKAAAEGAELIVLPEVFGWRGRQDDEAGAAETIPGPTSDFVASLARRLSVHMVAGSILEQDSVTAKAVGSADATRKCYNTSLLFSSDGDLLATYRKIHLFEVEMDARVSISEASTRAAGANVVCVNTALGRIGLAICYDLRFPELFRRLSDLDAEIVAVPSAFTEPTGRAHWHTLVRARAIENQCFVVAANQFGATDFGFSDYGHSLVVDPWGEVLADGGADGAGAVTAALRASRLSEVRRRLPSLSNRRLPS